MNRLEKIIRESAERNVRRALNESQGPSFVESLDVLKNAILDAGQFLNEGVRAETEEVFSVLRELGAEPVFSGARAGSYEYQDNKISVDIFISIPVANGLDWMRQACEDYFSEDEQVRDDEGGVPESDEGLVEVFDGWMVLDKKFPTGKSFSTEISNGNVVIRDTIRCGAGNQFRDLVNGDGVINDFCEKYMGRWGNLEGVFSLQEPASL